MSEIGFNVPPTHRSYGDGPYLKVSYERDEFTTPIKGGKCNFASDTKRELDHLDAVKGIRSGSNLSTLTCRMSLMDTLNESKHHRSYSKRSSVSDHTDNLGWNITEVDENHIFLTTALILRQVDYL